MRFDYESCDNCGDRKCSEQLAKTGHDMTIPCIHDWKPMPCPSCGGILSEAREHNGKRYRHCYACHFEFEEEK